MKISKSEIQHERASKSHQIPGRAAICILSLLLTFQVHGQAPSLLWSTNQGANLFAVDAQTNLYANAGGAVIRLTAEGVPLQTNTICPLPGIAQRDAAGNFYFAGNFDGTQNFGGITLVGGWINDLNYNPPRWVPGWPTLFVAKYNAAGALQWVNSFGHKAYSNELTDVLVDSAGAVYAGHLGIGSSPRTPMITRLSDTGAFLWSQTLSGGGFASRVKLGGLTSSNCVFIMEMNDSDMIPRRISTGGVVSSVVPAWGLSGNSANAKPIIDNLGQVILAGRCYPAEAGCSGQRYLRKYALDTSTAWSVLTGLEEQWVVARDAGENIYLGGTSNLFAKYNTDGNLLWTNNYSKKIINMSVDASGNRFLGFSDGAIARLGPDAAPVPPQILSGPQTQIVGLGSNAAFTVTAAGSPALIYQWRKDGTNVGGGTASATNYTITGVTTNSVGAYDVVVTNLYGSVTSAPAALLVAPSLLSPYVGAVGLWGQQATLSVSAWGSGTLSYQWYKSGQAINGATNNTLVFPSVQISDAGAYSVVVTSAYGSVTNTPADLVVNPAEVSIALYAGITIHGTAGYSYGIEYATNLQNATWLNLTNITLTQPVEIWVDTTVPAAERARRFYRVTAQ